MRTLERMTYLRILAATEIRAAVAVIVVSLVGAIYWFVDAASSPASLLSPPRAFVGALIYALVLGLPVALLVCAPIYALLRYKGIAWWSTAFFLGAAPGVVLLYSNDYGLAATFIVNGLAAALLTHLLWRRHLPKVWRAKQEANAL